MDISERRLRERDTCKIQATISGAPGAVPVPCLVRDLSDSGALLDVDQALPLPDTFRLGLPIAQEIVDERRVELRWREGRSVGVRFVRG